MEMSRSATGMANAWLAGSDINSYTAANAIFYAAAACSTGMHPVWQARLANQKCLRSEYSLNESLRKIPKVLDRCTNPFHRY